VLLQGRGQRASAVDYVDNLEKQHVSQIKDSVQQACTARRGLLVKLTELTQRLMQVDLVCYIYNDWFRIIVNISIVLGVQKAKNTVWRA